MPAAAMSAAILVLLIFVDVSSLGSGVEDSSTGGAPAAARSVEDAAKQSAESATGAPPVLPRAAQPVPGTGGNTQGFGPTPQPAGAVAPQSAPAPPGATPFTAQAPAPVAPNATPAAPLVLPPVIGSPASGNSLAQPTPASGGLVIGPDEIAAEHDEEDKGTNVLRVLQVIAALALVASIGGLIWQRQHR